MLYYFFACFPELPERQFPPSLTVIFPDESRLEQIDAPFNVGEFIPFEFQITDFDSELSGIEVNLISNIDGHLFQGYPDSEGYLSILLASLSAGEHQLTVSISDDVNRISDTFSIRLNNPPPPPIISILPENPTTEDDLYVDVQNVADLDGEDVSYSIEWLRSGIVESDEDSAYLASSMTSKGERWYVRVTPSDLYSNGVTAEASVIIVNSPPEIVSVAFSPSDIYNDQSVLCEVEVTDADEDAYEVNYQWSLLSQGTLVDLEQSEDQMLARPEEISANDRVYCNIQVSDGEDIAEGDAQILVSNRTPVFSEVLVQPSTGVRSGETLQCYSFVEDPDGDSFGVSYLWQNGTDLIGVGQSLELTPENAVKGDTLTCVAIVQDTHGALSTETKNVVIENTPPEVSFVVLTPSSPSAEDDLLCYTNAVDIDSSDIVSMSYQWQINGVPIVHSSDTLLASSGAFSHTDSVTCIATPSDGVDSGMSVSHTVDIENAPPQLIDIVLGPSTVQTNTLLSATVDVSDPDGHNLDITYNWFVDGVLVQSSIYNYLEGSVHFEKGQTVHVEVVVSDGFVSTGETSSSVQVVNSPPSDPIVVLPEYSMEDESLHCEISVPATDPDGDTLDYQFEWTVGISVNSGLLTTVWPNDTLSSSVTELGDELVCTVTVSDGEDTSSALTESTIAACDVQYIYNIEEDLSDLYNTPDCIELGKSNNLPPVSFTGLTTSSSADGINLNCFANTYACTAYNTGDSLTYYNYAYFPAGSVAFHSDTSINTGFRWQAPTDGTCHVYLYLYGVTSFFTASTDAGVSLYHEDVEHNMTLLDFAHVQGYQVPHEFDLPLTVSAGDHIYLLSSGGWIYNWLGVSGEISCIF